MTTPADDTQPLDNVEETPRPGVERTMVFVVVLLGIAIVACLVAIGLRVMYLASRPAVHQAEVPQAVAPAAETQGAVPSGLRLGLPVGAAVKGVALDGSRLAVHYDAPGGAGIAIIDIATGETVARVVLVPEGVVGEP